MQKEERLLLFSNKLSAEQRIKKNAEIKILLQTGRILKSDGFKLYYTVKELNESRFSVICPKRIFKRAVDRNQVKRIFREIFRTKRRYIFCSGDFLFYIMEKKILGLEFKEIETQIDRLIEIINNENSN